MNDAAGNLPVAMPNLIAGRRIVPELLQDRFSAQNVATELAPLLADTPERHAQIVALAELRHSLLAPRSLEFGPGTPPLERAADIVVDLIIQSANPVRLVARTTLHSSNLQRHTRGEPCICGSFSLRPRLRECAKDPMLRPRSILRSEFKLRCFVSILVALALTPLAAIAAIPARQQINVTGYVIKADLDPATGRLNATATVTFATLEDLTSVVFGLNNGLQITSLTSADKSTLTPERNAADSTVRVGLAAPLTKGTNSTWTFTYGGTPTVDTSPVDGINFAPRRRSRQHPPISRPLVPHPAPGPLHRPLYG